MNNKALLSFAISVIGTNAILLQEKPTFMRPKISRYTVLKRIIRILMMVRLIMQRRYLLNTGRGRSKNPFIAPVKLLLADVTDGNGKVIDVENDREMGIIKAAYRIKNADKQLIVVPGDFTGKLSDLYNEWIK
jgi:hypothetical protein